jgi:pyridoxine 4-dehydrogenase
MSDPTQEAPGGTCRLAQRSVARIGFGTMQLYGPGDRPAPPRDQALGVLRRAVELGVNHLDTAHFYGNGVVNELIRTALAPYPEDLVLVSKVGAEEDASGRLRPAQRPAELRAVVEANLTGLGVERLDVINLRRADAPPGIIAEGDQRIDLDSQLAELVLLRDEGKIGGIGLSNVSIEQLNTALPVGVACVQNAYSLLDRSGEALLAACRDHEIAWVPFFPLGSAFSAWDSVTDDPSVVATAERLGATPAQVGLAWLLAHYEGTLLIPGTTSVAHLEENVATGRLSLDDEAMALLDTALPAQAR